MTLDLIYFRIGDFGAFTLLDKVNFDVWSNKFDALFEIFTAFEVFVQLVDKENSPKAPTTGARRGKLISKNLTKIKVRKVFTFFLYFFEISHLSSGNICFERFLKIKENKSFHP